jgi:hypothetical protein
MSGILIGSAGSEWKIHTIIDYRFTHTVWLG